MNCTQPIDLNNLAVACLQKGDLSHTVDILVVAIDLIQCQMQTIQNSPQNEANANEEVDSVVIRQVHVAPPSVTQEADIASSMHCRALMISNEHINFHSENGYRRVSAVVLYNLALVNHSRGLQAGLTSDLAKALKLYEMSIALIHEQAQRSDLQCMAIAILRNMGHIHSYLFHLKEAKACFDSLRHILSNVEDAHGILPDGDYETFLSVPCSRGMNYFLPLLHDCVQRKKRQPCFRLYS